MVDVKEYVDRYNRLITEVTTDKTDVKYTVGPTRDGYIFFEIIPSSGVLPEKLRTKYSSSKKAVTALLDHVDRMKKTPAKRVKDNQKDYKRATTDQPDSKDDV